MYSFWHFGNKTASCCAILDKNSFKNRQLRLNVYHKFFFVYFLLHLKNAGQNQLHICHFPSFYASKYAILDKISFKNSDFGKILHHLYYFRLYVLHIVGFWKKSSSFSVNHVKNILMPIKHVKTIFILTKHVKTVLISIKHVNIILMFAKHVKTILVLIKHVKTVLISTKHVKNVLMLIKHVKIILMLAKHVKSILIFGNLRKNYLQLTEIT